MRQEYVGRVTSINIIQPKEPDVDVDTFSSEITFPEPLPRAYLGYVRLTIPGRLELGSSMKLIFTDEED